MRLRTDGLTISTTGSCPPRFCIVVFRSIRKESASFPGGARLSHFLDTGLHSFRNCFDNRYYNGISKLFISLGVGNGDFKKTFSGAIKSHQSRAFSRCKPSGVFFALSYKDFGAILVISCRQGTGCILSADKAETKAVTFGLVFFCVILKIIPKVIRKRVFIQNSGFCAVRKARLFCFTPVFRVQNR